MVHRRDQLRAFENYGGASVDESKIEMVWNSEIEEVLGDGKRVTGVRVKNLVSGPAPRLSVAGCLWRLVTLPILRF